MIGPANLFDRRTTAVALAGLLLVLHFGLAVGSKQRECTATDELAHLTAGYTYWKFDDYRLQPENGNLPQRWAALPAFLQDATFPTLDQVYWRTSDVWVMGHQFFYETGQDHFPRLMAGRAMIALFSVATGVLIFLWSRSLFGNVAGLFSLTLFAFSPLFLAHGALVTSDTCMTFFFLAAVGAWWRQMNHATIGTVTLSAVTFGVACIAKFSAVLLLPMFALLAVVRIIEPEPWLIGPRGRAASRRAKVIATACSGILHAAIAVLIIWAAYGFRYSAFNPDVPAASQFIIRWDIIVASIGAQGTLIQLLAKLHALPQSFLYGYAYVIESTHSRAAFLNGDYSTTGWPTFFPWAFLLKSTPSVLFACVAMCGIMARRWIAAFSAAIATPLVRRAMPIFVDLRRVLPLAVLFGVYWAFSLTSHLNIGQRHIQPIYPVLFIGAGCLVAATRSLRSVFGCLVFLCAAGQVAEAARIWPDYLAYFNGFFGGPTNGYRHLVDSSLDWGQDLPGLGDWLRKYNQPALPVYLSYAGSGEPAYYGITAEKLVMINGFKIAQPFVPLRPGLYCIGATCLQQVYSPFRGRWNAEKERVYEQLRLLEPALIEYTHDHNREEWLKVAPAETWDRQQSTLETLRFARLCEYLRAREPLAQIGYSIKIYAVTAEDLRALGGSPSDWNRAISSR